MKPRNREVNIFNMSVLDLLTGALGAFCFLALALFPSYNEAQSQSAVDEQLEAEQQRLQQQFGKASKGIPPFSLWRIGTLQQPGYSCGVFELGELQAPRGNKSFRRLPFRDTGAEGYDWATYLFTFDPGPYRLTVKAYATTLPCDLILSRFHPDSAKGLSMRTSLTASPVSYPFDFEVKSEHLITSILPHK